MDSLITAAALSLASGDPLGALKRVALRDDAPALALRGIAMAQLGDLLRARRLLKRAGRAFGPEEAVARARCLIAEAEVAFAARDLGWPAQALEAARVTLESHGDRLNAAHARYLAVRRALLLGRLAEAGAQLARLDPTTAPPALRTAHALMLAGIAMRRVQTRRARQAIAQATRAAAEARIPALTAEVDEAARRLVAPAARLIGQGDAQTLRLDGVEALFASPALVIDACRFAVRQGARTVSLARRPVLFALARALGEAWPADVTRERLLADAFGARFVDGSHRARLRVEIGRLRSALRPFGAVTATRQGFALVPRADRPVRVLAPLVDDAHASVLACLADGEAWSSSALALALGASQRTLQRALDTLAETGKVQAIGRGRARRWTMPPMPGFTTPLLLPAPLPTD